VIAPGTWDVNGGAGSIYYWAPGHAMVILQTDDVHDQIADVLLQLQNANR
jgi:type 1 glutamine amidotransferase